jgi:hypothetical protein
MIGQYRTAAEYEKADGRVLCEGVNLAHLVVLTLGPREEALRPKRLKPHATIVCCWLTRLSYPMK